MARRVFTNKFKVGDEVICIKQSEPLANLQPGDIGKVITVDASWKKYEVQINNKPKGHDECYAIENNLDFANERKRQPKPVKDVRVKRITPPRDSKAARLKLIKKRAKIFMRKQIVKMQLNIPPEITASEETREEFLI